MKNPWIILSVISVVLIGGSIWYSSTVSESNNQGVVIKTHMKGSDTATVTLVEYSDFQCPACAEFQPIVDELVSDYSTELKFEYRHFPLSRIHPFAEAAARAAEAAGQQGKFFEYHDLLFINQKTWSAGVNPSQYFIQYAKELDLDMDLFMKQQRSSVIRNHVRSQFAEAQALGFTGTPSFVLNGQKMQITSYENFRAQIEAAINPAVNFGPEGGVIINTTGANEATGSEMQVEATNEGETLAPAVRFGI